MDPVSALGLAASIIAVVQLTGSCLKSTQKVLGPSQHSSNDLQTISATLYAFNGSIRNLQTHLEICEEDQARLQALEYLQKPLQDSEVALKVIESRVKNLTFLGRHVVGVRFDSKLKRCLRVLDDSGSLLSLALQADQKVIISSVERYVRNIAEDMRDIKASINDNDRSIRSLDEQCRENHDEVKHLQLATRDKVRQTGESILSHSKDWKAKEEQLRQQCEDRTLVEWLSSLNFWTKHDDVLSARHELSGTWLLESPQFEEWLAGPPRALWCVGIPGAGKTVLASVVIDHLRRSDPTPDVAVVCVYYSYKEQETQSAVNIIANILQQLVQKNMIVSDEMRALHQKHKEHRTRPTLAEVSALLRSTLKTFRKTFVVMDALDECIGDNSSREVVLREIQILRPFVYLMVTSRPTASTAYGFGDAIHLEISAKEHDIRDYCAKKIRSEHRLALHVKGDTALQEEITNTIVHNSKGMFLLARLHLDSLAKEYSRKRMRSTLRNLPQELDGTYDQAWQRIHRQDKVAVELAERVLIWISHAYRLLSIGELQHALAIGPKDVDFDTDAVIDSHLILSVCAGLVTIDQESSIIRLVHYTTQAFFERVRSSYFPNAQTEITRVCLIYLSSDAFAGGYCKRLGERIRQHKLYPFLSYAARYWAAHGRGAPEKQLEAIILDLLAQPLKVECLFQASGRHSNIYGESTKWPKNVSSLSAAASFGSKHIVKAVLEHEPQVHVCDSNGFTALHYAILSGEEAVVLMLLENGADIDAEVVFEAENNVRTALQFAVRYTNDRSMVELLLSRGAHINTMSSAMTTALHDAKDFDMCLLLLEGGADFDMQDCQGWTPLHNAVLNGYKDMVSLLLEWGARFDMQDYHGLTPLHMAVLGEDEDMVSLLVNWGCSTMIKSASGRTALLHAVMKDSTEIVRLLLELGADVAMRDGYQQTLLMHAAKYSGAATVRTVLEHKEDVNAQDSGGETALIKAAFVRKVEIVRALIESGADIHLPDSYNRTALFWAACLNDESTVQLLLESGTGSSLMMEARTALEVATVRGHERVAELIREYCAGSETPSSRLSMSNNEA